jgi:excisionase family DNA binding protein
VSQEVLTLAEVAEALGVHYMTAYRYVRTGRLPGTKVGAEWRVRADDLARLAAPRAAGTRRRGDYPRRLEERLLAGDEGGAWRVVEGALTAGVEPAELYLDVIAPALAAIGDAWSRGAVSVADEHRASVVTLRIIGRLGPRFGRRGRKRGTIVVGAPPDDQHGLPVALFADLLRGAGFEVVDLGADAPAESFADAARDAERLVAVGICATTPGNERAVRRTVAAVRATVDAPVVVGGGAIADGTVAADLGADAWGGPTVDALGLFDRLAEDAGRARRRAGPAA